MLRSVVIKGMEGLWVEALLAARERGVVEPLLAMIEETLDRYSARDFATMLVTTHVAHAGRRQVEVRMSRDTVAGTGVPSLLSDGIVARYEHDARGAGRGGSGARRRPAHPGRPRSRRSSARCRRTPRLSRSATGGPPLLLRGDQGGAFAHQHPPALDDHDAGEQGDSCVGVPGDRVGGGGDDEPEHERTEGGAGAHPPWVIEVARAAMPGCIRATAKVDSPAHAQPVQ